MFRVGQVFYHASLPTVGESKILFVAHYYLDRVDDGGKDLRFRELVRIDGEWRISSTDTVFGDGTETDVLKYLVMKNGLAEKITQLTERLAL